MNGESERAWKTNGWLGTTTGRRKGEDAGGGEAERGGFGTGLKRYSGLSALRWWKKKGHGVRHDRGETFLRGKSSEPFGEFLPASGLKKELAR